MSNQVPGYSSKTSSKASCHLPAWCSAFYDLLYKEPKAYNDVRPYLSDRDPLEDRYFDEVETPYYYCRDISSSVCINEDEEWNLAEPRWDRVKGLDNVYKQYINCGNALNAEEQNSKDLLPVSVSERSEAECMEFELGP